MPMILLVEDNPDHELLAMRALHRNGIDADVHVARDGTEALDFLFGTGDHAGRDTEEQPTVVLLDLKLPKVDGLEVLRQLRQNPQTRMIPVVVLTSSDEEEDLVSGYSLGANSYIRKPVEFDKFVEAAKQLKLYWLLLNEAPPRASNREQK